METPIITNKPLSSGDGRGQSKSSPRSRTEPGVSRDSEVGRSDHAEPTPQDSSILGADGEPVELSEGFVDNVVGRGRDMGCQAGELGKRVSQMTQEYTEREPARALLISLGVGVVLGAVIGALLARD